MKTAAELDRMHDAVVAQYPGGVSYKQYVRIVLESADERGKVYPHSLANAFDQMSALFQMSLDGLISNRGRYDEPFDWHITEAGRAALTSQARPKCGADK